MFSAFRLFWEAEQSVRSVAKLQLMSLPIRASWPFDGSVGERRVAAARLSSTLNGTSTPGLHSLPRSVGSYGRRRRVPRMLDQQTKPVSCVVGAAGPRSQWRRLAGMSLSGGQDFSSRVLFSQPKWTRNAWQPASDGEETKPTGGDVTDWQRSL